MAKNWITPPSVKFELRAYGQVYDFSNCIDNWKDLQFTLKRDDTSGIFHQISFPFEFVLDAYDVVKQIFDTYKYSAKADVYIYLLKDKWPYLSREEQYYEPQIFNLDWATYTKSDSKIEMHTKRTSLYDFIKAKNKIVYDIPVSEMKEEKQWNFERINLDNKITFRCTSDESKQITFAINAPYERTLGISYEETEVLVKDIIEVKTLPFDSEFKATIDSKEEDSYFMKLYKDANSRWVELEIDIKGKIRHGNMGKITLNLGTEVASTEQYAASYEVDLKTEKGEATVGWKQKVKIKLNKGDGRCYLMIRYERDSYKTPTAHVNIDGTIKVNYGGVYKPVKIDLIDPKTLLQSLVDKMTDSKGTYYSEIEDFNTDSSNLIMMSAAESIRGIQTTKDDNGEITTEAKVHTSYRKFVEWMNAYGYEQHVAGNKLTFRKRNKGFRADLIAIELEQHECADLREYVNEDYLFSGLKIGYNKKDIENINGRFEFNGIHNYSSDLNLGENILELISPYRADCYGIEFLTQERDKETTDDKSDKDLFLINVAETSENYETVHNTFSGNCPLSIDQTEENKTKGLLFNGNLNPYNLMKLNEDLLGVSINTISFAASDSNSKIVIDNQKIDGDYDIPKDAGLFEAITYDIASKNIQQLPTGEHVNGLIRFKYKGKTYEGFIDEVSKNPAWESETTWILHKKRG